jgi:hypothetical protein
MAINVSLIQVLPFCFFSSFCLSVIKDPDGFEAQRSRMRFIFVILRLSAPRVSEVHVARDTRPSTSNWLKPIPKSSGSMLLVQAGIGRANCTETTRENMLQLLRLSQQFLR